MFLFNLSLHVCVLPQQPDALETFNRGAMVGLLVVAVAIAMVMVISLLLVRRKPYGTISHGIVEVRSQIGRSFQPKAVCVTLLLTVTSVKNKYK